MPEEWTSRIAETVTRLLLGMLMGGVLWAIGSCIAMTWFDAEWALWPLLLCLAGGALLGLIFHRHIFQSTWATLGRFIDSLWWWS